MADAIVSEPVLDEKSAVKAEQTPITDDLEKHWGEVVATMRNMSAYYGYTGELPVHVLEALGKDDGRSPVEQRKRVLQKLHIHLLAKWAKGEIPGPLTTANLDARAKRAEQSAENMRKMKNAKAAESFAAKAAAIRATAPNDSSTAWW